MSSGTPEWIAERGGFRVGVEQRADGLFQVHLERWIRGAVLEEPSYWSRVSSRAVLSDSASSARALASEELNAAVPEQA